MAEIELGSMVGTKDLVGWMAPAVFSLQVSDVGMPVLRFVPHS